MTRLFKAALYRSTRRTLTSRTRPSGSPPPSRPLFRTTSRRVRLLSGTVLTGVAVGATVVVVPFVAGADSSPRPVAATLKAAQDSPPAPVRLAARASRGGARSTLPPMKYVTKDVAVGSTFSGEASWYGGSFQGRTTANGESFDTNELTAASKTLPFGTRLQVCRADTCVVVRVNDRGPYVGGRVLDLSQAAAQQLGYDGVANVTATPVEATRVAVPDREAAQSIAATRKREQQRAEATRKREQQRAEIQTRGVLVLAAQESLASPGDRWLLAAAGAGLTVGGGVFGLRRRRTRSA